MKGTNANGHRQCTHMRVTEMIPQAQRQDLYLKESELQHQFLSYQPGKRKKDHVSQMNGITLYFLVKNNFKIPRVIYLFSLL